MSQQAWAIGTASTEARFGNANFLVRSVKVGSTSFVAAQTLAAADRVASDLTALELVAGPVLLLGVFLGTLLIGVKAAEPVEAARRRQLEFTADASHELRTPLSVIEAEVTLALIGQRTEEEYQSALKRVGHESRRLTAIVEDLLWLSRFDSAPPPPRDVLVDVGAIGVSCADRFAVVARQRGIALTFDSRRRRCTAHPRPRPNGSIGWPASSSTTHAATPVPGARYGSGSERPATGWR